MKSYFNFLCSAALETNISPSSRKAIHLFMVEYDTESIRLTLISIDASFKEEEI